MRCLNKSTLEYKKLSEIIKSPLLDATIVNWQDRYNTERFPTIDDLYYHSIIVPQDIYEKYKSNERIVDNEHLYNGSIQYHETGIVSDKALELLSEPTTYDWATALLPNSSISIEKEYGLLRKLSSTQDMSKLASIGYSLLSPESREAIDKQYTGTNISNDIFKLKSRYKELSTFINWIKALSNNMYVQKLSNASKNILEAAYKNRFSYFHSGSPVFSTLENAVEFAKRLIPNITSDQLQLISFIDMNDKLKGYVKDFKTHISDLNKKVIQHELFHMVWRYGLTVEQRKEIVGDLQGHEGPVEEILAQMFERTENESKLTKQIRKVFDKIRYWLGFLTEQQYLIDTLFNDIWLGKYSIQDNDLFSDEATYDKTLFSSIDEYMDVFNRVQYAIELIQKGNIDTTYKDLSLSVYDVKNIFLNYPTATFNNRGYSSDEKFINQVDYVLAKMFDVEVSDLSGFDLSSQIKNSDEVDHVRGIKNYTSIRYRLLSVRKSDSAFASQREAYYKMIEMLKNVDFSTEDSIRNEVTINLMSGGRSKLTDNLLAMLINLHKLSTIKFDNGRFVDGHDNEVPDDIVIFNNYVFIAKHGETVFKKYGDTYTYHGFTYYDENADKFTKFDLPIRIRPYTDAFDIDKNYDREDNVDMYFAALRLRDAINSLSAFKSKFASLRHTNITFVKDSTKISYATMSAADTAKKSILDEIITNKDKWLNVYYKNLLIGTFENNIDTPQVPNVRKLTFEEQKPMLTGSNRKDAISRLIDNLLNLNEHKYLRFIAAWAAYLSYGTDLFNEITSEDYLIAFYQDESNLQRVKDILINNRELIKENYRNVSRLAKANVFSSGGIVLYELAKKLKYDDMFIFDKSLNTEVYTYLLKNIETFNDTDTVSEEQELIDVEDNKTTLLEHINATSAKVLSGISKAFTYGLKLIPSSIRNANGDLRYLNIPSSYAFRLLDNITNRTGGVSKLDKLKRLKPLKHLFKDIVSVSIHDATKSKNNYVTEFTEEDVKTWLNREFVAGYVNNGDKMIITLSPNEDRKLAIQIEFTKYSDRNESIFNGILDLILSRDNLNEFIKNYNIDSNINFEVFTSGEIKQLRGLTGDALKNKKKELYNTYKKRIRQIAEELHKVAEANNVSTDVNALNNWIMDTYGLQYLFGYVIGGDVVYNKNSFDRIKRLGGATATGEVGNYANLPNKMRVAVGKDLYRHATSALFNNKYRLTPVNEFEQILGLDGFSNDIIELFDNDDVLLEWANTTSDHSKESAIRFLDNNFSKFAYTDGEAYILPETVDLLTTAYSEDANIGGILKPAHFGDASLSGIDVVTMLKCSAVELSDSLVENRPELQNLRNFMRSNNFGMFVHESAVKQAIPKQLFDTESILRGEPINIAPEPKTELEIGKLFDSNPNLANQVYEALGFQGDINLESNLKNTGKTEQELIEYLKKTYPEIKLNISNNPIWEESSDIVKNQEEYNKEVQYRLKATEILLSDKAKQIFDKGRKNLWSLDKILTELAVPKEQKALLLDLGIADREQLISNIKPKDGVSELFESNPELAQSVYEALGFNQLITSNDKIVWGHPTIGKTTMLESDPNAFIDWDNEFNRKRDNWIANKSNTVVGTPEFKKARNEYMINYNNHKDYIAFVTEEWNKAKEKANKESKILIASPHMLLNLFPNDFDKIITMSDKTFMDRAVKRSNGDVVNSKLWKEGINETLKSVDKSKIIETDKYINDLFITPQQKQQAIELYAQYLDTKKDSLDDLIDKLIREGVITAEDENGNTCAESGLTTSVKGSNWKIVKDLKGPSHKLGGIDLTIGNDGISFKRNNSDVKAKNGLLIAQDNSVLPPGKKVQVRQSDNSIKEYNINSKEYEDLYNSGHLVNYDKNTDTYIATSLPEVTITANKPQWAKDKEQFEKEYTKDMFMDETMPKFSRAMGISATNMNPNNIAEYDKRINDKVVENIFKRKPTFDTDYSNDRLKTLQGFSQKELELIKNSSYAHKIEPSIWSKFEQGLLSVGNAGSPIQFKNQNLTQDEAKKENNPLNLLQPLNIPAKIAQSTYKKDYSFSDALKGKQNNAGIVEDIVTDPLNLVGLGIWGKLSKTGKFAKLEDAYQAVNGLNKEEALNKLKQIPSDSDIEVAEQILKKSYKKEELPKLEQIPLDFNIEDLMKGISSTDRKNMTIIKEGNKYFKELNNPESLKRLKEFGDEYGIDLLDAYKKAEQRWSKGTNFREHENFQVKKTDEDWYGLSTVKRDTKDDMYRYLLQKEFGKDSKQVKDFDKKISQDNSVNYISDKVPLDKYSKTVWHELSHDINKSIIDSSPKLQEDIKSIFIEKGTADLDKVKKARESVAEDYYTKKEKVLSDLNSKESLQKVGEREFDYVTYPTETWAFLSTNLRQDLKNTGIIKNYNELLTVEKLEQAIKNGNTVFSRFEPYIKDKDKFIKLFNKMTLGIAPAVMYLQSQQKNN